MAEKKSSSKEAVKKEQKAAVTPVKKPKATDLKKTSAKESKTTGQVPTVKEHLQESWDMIVGSLKNLVLLWLTMVSALFVMMLVVGIASLGGIMSAGGFSVFNNPAAFYSLINSSSGALIGIVAAVTIIAYTFINFGATAAVMLSLNRYKEKPGFGEVLSSGMKLALPLFLLGIVGGLLVAGGYALFIIPGIVIAIFLSFSMFEKVLYGASLMDSLKGSYTVVKSHFGTIFVRWLVVVGFYLVFYAFVPEVLNAISEGLKSAYGMITSLGGIVINWLVMAYFIILYRETRKQTDMTKLSGIGWMWLVSGIGWLILAVITLLIVNMAPSLMEEFNRKPNPFDTTQSDDFQMMLDESAENDGGGEFNFDADIDTEGLTPDQQQAIEEAEAAMGDYFQQMQEAAEAAQ